MLLEHTLQSFLFFFWEGEGEKPVKRRRDSMENHRYHRSVTSVGLFCRGGQSFPAADISLRYG